MNLGHGVDAVNDDPFGFRRVQRGALFRRIDPVAAEHGLDPLPQAALLGQSREQAHRLIGDAVLGVVEVEAVGLGGQTLAAAGIVGEEPPQMKGADSRSMNLKRFPRRAVRQGRPRRFNIGGQRCGIHGHIPLIN